MRDLQDLAKTLGLKRVKLIPLCFAQTQSLDAVRELGDDACVEQLDLSSLTDVRVAPHQAQFIQGSPGFSQSARQRRASVAVSVQEASKNS